MVTLTMRQPDAAWSGMTTYLSAIPTSLFQAQSVADVAEAVKLARSRGLRISIRAGGHSWIATSLRDGGISLICRGSTA